MNDSRYDAIIRRIKDLIIVIGIPLIVLYGLKLHSLQVDSLKAQSELYKVAFETQADAYRDQISTLKNQLAVSNEHRDLLKELRYPDALEIVRSQRAFYDAEKVKFLKKIESSKEVIDSYRKTVFSLSRRPSIEEYNGLVKKYHELAEKFVTFLDEQILVAQEQIEMFGLGKVFWEKIKGIFVSEPGDFPESIRHCFTQIARKYGITSIDVLQNFEIHKRISAFQDMVDCIDSSYTSAKIGVKKN